jgi:hypothetical protein
MEQRDEINADLHTNGGCHTLPEIRQSSTAIVSALVGAAAFGAISFRGAS